MEPHDPSTPEGPVLQPVRTRGPHPVVAVLVIAAAVLLVGAGLLGRAMRQAAVPPLPEVSPRPAIASAATVSPAVSPGPSRVAPLTEMPPITAGGWPVTAVGPIWSEPTVAPDGSLYVAFEQGRVGRAQVISLDSRGRMRPGWPYLAPSGESVVGPSVGRDGTLWVATSGATLDSPRVVALSPDGSPRTGWPIEVPGLLASAPPVPGPGGSAYVLQRDDRGTTQLLGLSPAGDVLRCYPLTLDRTGDVSFNNAALVAADGTVFAAGTAVDATSEALRIVTLRAGSSCAGATYRLRGQNPGAALLPDGRLLGWTFDIAPRSLGVGPAVRGVDLVVIGVDGRVAPGWPRSIRGVASVPAVGPDGTVYLTLGKSCSTAAGSVLAVRPDGTARPGWPAPLPAGFGGAWLFPQSGQPCVASTPVVDPDGGVHALVGDPVSGEAAVASIGPDGVGRAGWPYRLYATDQRPTIAAIGALGGALPPVVGPDGWVYQGISGPPGSVVVLDERGKVVARELLAEGMAIASLQLAPDGRLLVTAVTRSRGFAFVTLLMLGPDPPGS